MSERTDSDRLERLENAFSNHLHNHETTPSWVKVSRVASVSFFTVFTLAIASIKVKYEAFSFEVPIEALVTALSAPPVAALITGWLAYAARKKF